MEHWGNFPGLAALQNLQHELIRGITKEPALYPVTSKKNIIPTDNGDSAMLCSYRATTEHRATEQLQVLAALGPGLLLVINGIMNS